MKKKTAITKNFILESYADYILKNDKQPAHVFAFCEYIKIKEEEFYQFYSGFEAIEKDFFVTQFENTMALLKADAEFVQADAQHKLLSFYYTFFEQLMLNRSLALCFVDQDKNKLENLKKLIPLKQHFQLFIQSLELNLMQVPERLNKVRQKSIIEMSWIQFLVTLKFWINDDSPAFEKTDIFIEKSVMASFELAELTPLKKVIDFGKFLWKEKSVF